MTAALSHFDPSFPLTLDHLSAFPDTLQAMFDNGVKDFNSFTSATLANLTAFNTPRAWMTNRDFKIGRELADRGLRKKHAVVMIPGVISSGLESWSTGMFPTSQPAKQPPCLVDTG